MGNLDFASVEAHENNSPYARVGAKLVSQGFSAIPCRPGSKIPGDYNLGEWFPKGGWQRFCDRLPTPIETDIFEKWPQAGVCVALGFDVVVVDIDTTDHKIIAAVERVLPPSPVQKVGQKGYGAFYRAPGVKDKKFPINGRNVVEILAYGRQAVIPPSIHPQTGKPYIWVGDALDRYTPDSLPELPADIAERIAEALKPFGYEAKPERPEFVPASGDDDNEWSETNETALANLDAWVPDLGIGARREGASWRGNARKDGDSFALSFHPRGIKDFVTGEGFSAIDIVAKIAGVEPCDAMRMLRKKLGIKDPPRIRLIFRREWPHVWPYPWSAPVVIERVRPEDPVMAAAAEIARAEAGDEAWAAHSEAAFQFAGDHLQHARDSGVQSSAERVAAWMMQQVHAGLRGGAKRTKPVLVARLDPEAKAEHSTGKHGKRDPLGSLAQWGNADWRRPGGLLGQITDWITETSFRPNRAIAVSAAIATVAPVLGRRLFTPTGAHCGVYVSCIAESGAGKDDPLNAVKRILNAAGLRYLHKTGKAFTGSGYESNLIESPVHVSIVDEGGKNLFSKVLDPRASQVEKALGVILLELYGFKDHSEPFELTKRARYVGNNKTDVEFYTEIRMPSLSLYSVSTPGSFYKNVTTDSVEDGLLNRIIQINGDQTPKDDNYLAEIVQVPDGIIERLQEIAAFGNDEKLGVPHIPDVVFGSRRRVPFLDSAEARQKEFGKEIDRLAKEHPFGELLRRVPENALRLATIHAVGARGPGAGIEERDQDFGAALAIQSARWMMHDVETRIASTFFEKDLLKLRGALKGGGWEARSDVLRATRLPAPKLNDCIRHMLETGELEKSELIKTGGADALKYKLIR